jgi:hypothetical protein
MTLQHEWINILQAAIHTLVNFMHTVWYRIAFRDVHSGHDAILNYEIHGNYTYVIEGVAKRLTVP